MALTLIFGNAFRVPETMARNDDRVRVYRTEHAAYIGHDTDELVHVCDAACAQTVREESGPWITCTSPSDAYVSEEDEKGDVRTIDTGAADYGDDPLIVCGACSVVLHRDDETFREQYGRDISQPAQVGEVWQ